MHAGAKALALVAVLAFAAGISVASVFGYGPLAYISYTVNGSGDGGSGNVTTVPVYFDLGNLTAGESGSVNGTATITLTSDGYYEFELEHESKLEKVFASFIVTIDVNGTTFTLDLYGEDSYKVYLTAGTYTVSVTVDYIVKSNPHSQSVSDLLFLKVYYDDSDDYDDDDDHNS